MYVYFLKRISKLENKKIFDFVGTFEKHLRIGT